MVRCTSIVSNQAQKLFNALFFKFGSAIYRQPCLFVLLGFAITIACGCGLYFMEMESAIVNLWVPNTSEIYKQYTTQEDNFGTYPMYMLLMLEGKDGANIMTPDALTEGYSLLSKIDDISYESVQDGSIYKYSDICEHIDVVSKTCTSNQVNLWNLFFQGKADLYSNQDYINGVLNTDGINNFVGNLKYDDTNKVTGGNIIRNLYPIRSTTDDDFVANVIEFERKFIEYWEEHNNDYENFNVIYISYHSMDDEIARTVSADAMMFVIAFAVMTVYLQLTLGNISCIRSRMFLATSSIIILIMALIIGFGLASYTGNKFSTLVFVVPFLLLGVGVDDMIIIVDTLKHTPLPGNNPDFRAMQLGLALQHSGIAISLTSFCSIIAFIAGTITDLPGVQYFCFFAAFSFLGNYILQFLMFIPFLVWDEKRIRNNRNSFCPCYIHDAVNNNADGNDNDNDHDDGNSYLDLALEKSLIAILSKKVGRWCIIITFCVLIGISAYAGSLVESVSDPTATVPDDSYVIEYNEVSKKGWSGSQPKTIQILFTDIDFSDKDIRTHIYSLISSLESLEQTTGPVENWLEPFTDYLETKGKDIDTISSSEFYSNLKEFEKDNDFVNWDDEILFNDYDNPTELKATKFYLTAIEPASGIDAWKSREFYTDIWDKQMDYFKNSGFIFQVDWVYSYFDNMAAHYTMMNLISSTIAVFLILALLMDIRLAVFIVIIIICIDICLFGWMYLVGINLDVLSFCQLCMAVGLTVDYVIHVTHAIAHVEVDNDDDYSKRVKRAIKETGTSVIKGAVTTFIGATVLAFSNSKAFRSFFYLLAGIVIIAMLFGLVWAPALLGEFKFIYSGLSEMHSDHQQNPSVQYAGIAVVSEESVDDPDDDD